MVMCMSMVTVAVMSRVMVVVTVIFAVHGFCRANHILMHLLFTQVLSAVQTPQLMEEPQPLEAVSHSSPIITHVSGVQVLTAKERLSRQREFVMVITTIMVTDEVVFIPHLLFTQVANCPQPGHVILVPQPLSTSPQFDPLHGKMGVHVVTANKR